MVPMGGQRPPKGVKMGTLEPKMVTKWSPKWFPEDAKRVSHLLGHHFATQMVPNQSKTVSLRRRCGTTIVINICVFFIREFFIGLFLIWLFFKRLVLVWLFFIRLFLFVFGGCCLPGTHWMVCQLAATSLHTVVPMLMTQTLGCKCGYPTLFT